MVFWWGEKYVGVFPSNSTLCSTLKRSSNQYPQWIFTFYCCTERELIKPMIHSVKGSKFDQRLTEWDREKQFFYNYQILLGYMSIYKVSYQIEIKHEICVHNRFSYLGGDTNQLNFQQAIRIPLGLSNRHWWHINRIF